MRGRAAFRACLLACLSTAPAGAGQLSLGTQADGWAANTLQPVRGWEVMVPVSVDLDAAPGLGLYAQTAFAAAGYTDQTSLDLTAMTDSVV
ncbi:MAG TPA: hypothetical protein VFR02_03975, partial [bacterium]|nr:hypothetical protein [bacterium]